MAELSVTYYHISAVKNPVFTKLRYVKFFYPFHVSTMIFLDFSAVRFYIIYCAVVGTYFVRTDYTAVFLYTQPGVVLVSTGILKMEKLSAG